RCFPQTEQSRHPCSPCSPGGPQRSAVHQREVCTCRVAFCAAFSSLTDTRLLGDLRLAPADQLGTFRRGGVRGCGGQRGSHMLRWFSPTKRPYHSTLLKQLTALQSDGAHGCGGQCGFHMLGCFPQTDQPHRPNSICPLATARQLVADSLHSPIALSANPTVPPRSLFHTTTVSLSATQASSCTV